MTNKKRDIILSAILAAVVLALLIYVDKEQHYSMLASVIQKAAIYALLAVSLNLLNGFTGLFSLGQAGFMMLGAYTYAILTIPLEQHASVYQYFNGGVVNVCLPAFVGVILAGLVAVVFAWLVGKPCLRLKSDYLAIATLGFAEILRALIQWDVFGPVTTASLPRSLSPRSAFSSSCCSSTPPTAAPSRRYARMRSRRRRWASTSPRPRCRRF